jgi:hypothetical protein
MNFREQAGRAVKLYTPVRGVLGSNIGRKLSILTKDF